MIDGMNNMRNDPIEVVIRKVSGILIVIMVAVIIVMIAIAVAMFVVSALAAAVKGACKLFQWMFRSKVPNVTVVATVTQLYNALQKLDRYVLISAL